MPSAEQPAAASSAGFPRTRWWIVWTLFGSTVINYINRQTFSVLAPVISKQFHLSHSDCRISSARSSSPTRQPGFWAAFFSMSSARASGSRWRWSGGRW